MARNPQIIREGTGYWDVTNYPYGGKFRRTSKDEPVEILGPGVKPNESKVRFADGHKGIVQNRFLQTSLANCSEAAELRRLGKRLAGKKNLFGLGKGTPREEIERRRHREVGKLLQAGKLREARRVRRQSTRRFARKHGLKVEGALRGAGRRAKERARSKAHGIVDRIFGSKNPVPALLTSLGSTLAEGAGFAAGEMGVTQLAKKKKKAHHMKTKRHAKTRARNPRLRVCQDCRRGKHDYCDGIASAKSGRSWDNTLCYCKKCYPERQPLKTKGRPKRNPSLPKFVIGVRRRGLKVEGVDTAKTQHEAKAKATLLRRGGARGVRIKRIPSYL